MLVARRGDWLSAQVGDEIVMMSAQNGFYIGLNAVGARIWGLLERPRAIDEICARLVEEFDVMPNACRTEVESFLAELERHGAIVMAPAPLA